MWTRNVPPCCVVCELRRVARLFCGNRYLKPDGVPTDTLAPSTAQGKCSCGINDILDCIFDKFVRIYGSNRSSLPLSLKIGARRAN